MPELPEVETIVRELRPRLRNKKIKRVEVRLPKIVSLGPKTLSNIRTTDLESAKKFETILVGKIIADVSRRAKLIIIDLAPHQKSTSVRGKPARFSILVHLKMTGQLFFLSKNKLHKKIRLLNIKNIKPEALPAKWTHVIFVFTDGSKLFYNDLRQFGYLKLVRDKEINQVKDLQEFGPEPLEKKFTFKVFRKILAKYPRVKLKQFLTNPKIIAGIGNIYSDEILYFAKTKPLRRIASLVSKEQIALYKGIKVILSKAIKKAGSSVGDFVRPNGSWGSFGKFHKVYGRSGLKCKTCGVIIKSIKLNGRTGSFCPKCQK